MPHPSNSAADASPARYSSRRAVPLPRPPFPFSSSPHAPTILLTRFLDCIEGESKRAPRQPPIRGQHPDENSKEEVRPSGAAASATAAADSLSDLRAPPAEQSAFRTRAGTDLPVAAVGTLSTPRFAVPDVRHVPGLGRGRTLVSVRQLARRGLAVTFGSESCTVKDPATGALVGEGRLVEEDGFYHLQYLRVPQS